MADDDSLCSKITAVNHADTDWESKMFMLPVDGSSAVSNYPERLDIKQEIRDISQAETCDIGSEKQQATKACQTEISAFDEFWKWLDEGGFQKLVSSRKLCNRTRNVPPASHTSRDTFKNDDPMPKDSEVNPAADGSTTDVEVLDCNDDGDDVDDGDGKVTDTSAMDDGTVAAGKLIKQPHRPLDATLFVMPYRCTVCGDAFSKSSELTQHVSDHGTLVKRRYRPTGGGPPYICQMCGKSLSSSFKLSEHLRMHTGEKPYCCEHCGSRFSRRDSLKQHALTHLSTTHACNICGRAYHTAEEQCEHVQRHLTGVQHECDVCRMKFLTKSALLRHAKTHTNKKPFSCLYCGAQFRRKDHLKKHSARLHSGGTMLRPTAAESGACLNDTDASGGQTVQWPTSEPTEACSQVEPTVDGDVTSAARSGVGINRKQPKAKPVCPLCCKSFRSQYKLKEHHAVAHLNERLFSCNVCEKTFGRADHLSRHVKNRVCLLQRKQLMHGNASATDQPSLSSLLEASGSLEVLSMIPETGRVGSCRSIKDGGRPKIKHRKSKTGRKNAPRRPLTCFQCNKHFTRRRVLDQHNRVVHNATVIYSCEKCQKEFSRQDRLSRHTKDCDCVPPPPQSIDDPEILDVLGQVLHPLTAEEFISRELSSGTNVAADATMDETIDEQSGDDGTEYMYDPSDDEESRSVKGPQTTVDSDCDKLRDLRLSCSMCNERFMHQSQLIAHQKLVHQVEPLCDGNVGCQQLNGSGSDDEQPVRNRAYMHEPVQSKALSMVPQQMKGEISKVGSSQESKPANDEQVSSASVSKTVHNSPEMDGWASGSNAELAKKKVRSALKSAVDLAVLACDRCGVQFDSCVELTNHQAVCWYGETSEISCNICDTKFTRRDHLTRHVRNNVCFRFKSAETR